jgi:hypothetical protein
LLAEYDRKDIKFKIKYRAAGKGEKKPEEETASEIHADFQSDLRPRTYSISAELKIRERGPQVSHPTDIILFEVIEE